MTNKGEVFREVCNAVIAKYGGKSCKMVDAGCIVWNDTDNRAITDWRKSFNWLIENGYLSEFDNRANITVFGEFVCKSRYHGIHKVGVTTKGWGVAHLYGVNI